LKNLIKTITYLFLLISASQIVVSQNILKDSIKEELTILPEVIFKKDVFSGFKISPDGKFFVSILESNIGYEIVVIDVDTHKLYKKFPIGRFPIKNISFVGSRRLLIEVIGKVIAIDVDGSNSSILVDNISGRKKYYYNFLYKYIRENNVINTLPEDDEHILIESFNYKGYSTIKKVNIYTGEEKIKVNGEKLKVHKWFLDLKGNVKIGFREKNNNFYFLKKSKKNGKWVQLLINLNNIKYVMKTSGSSYLNQSITFEGFAKEENIIYLGTNVDSDKRKLIAYNIEKNQYVETILENPVYDISDPMLSSSSLVYDDEGLLGMYYEGAYPVRKWISVKMQEYQTDIDKEYPSFINQIIGFSKGKERLLIKKWNDTYRGEIIIYDTKKKAFDTMLVLNEELKPFKLSKSKIISFKTKDNQTIQGYFNLPKSKSTLDKFPLVVIPHGGPFARDRWRYDPIVHFFNSKGFATLKINFRGSVGYGKEHLLKGINNINTVMISDLHQGVENIKKNNLIDAKNIFIYGHSYGGYAAYMSTINYPDYYNASVAVSAPSDLKLQMKEYKKNKKYFSYEFWEYALGSKEDKKLKEISPIYHAHKIFTPTFIFHGEKDKTISAEQAKLMDKKLKERGKQSSLRVIKKEGHSLYDSNNIIYILNKTVDFFNKNINK
jgi:dipeptidyl aminopeptidase/acylaminoacyl peptidase